MPKPKNKAAHKPRPAIGVVYGTVDELLAAKLPPRTVVVTERSTAWQVTHQPNQTWLAATDTALELDRRWDTNFRVVHLPEGTTAA